MALRLKLGPDRWIGPARLKRESCRPCDHEKPSCWQMPEAQERCPGGRIHGVECCLHIVHAEFVVNRLPTPEDTVLLRIGESISSVHWQQ
jgi:hypothetical protein